MATPLEENFEMETLRNDSSTSMTEEAWDVGSRFEWTRVQIYAVWKVKCKKKECHVLLPLFMRVQWGLRYEIQHREPSTRDFGLEWAWFIISEREHVLKKQFIADGLLSLIPIILIQIVKNTCTY